jgi:HEAT repeat protein
VLNRCTMTVGLDDLRVLLERLGDGAEVIAVPSLYALSDLDSVQLAEFSEYWTRFSADRKRLLLSSLVELAEASFEVNFDRIFRDRLDDPDDKVRATAVDGLWENESTSLIGPFLGMLRHDPSPEVRAAAARGLGRYVLAGELERLEAPVQARLVTELLTVLRIRAEGVSVRRRALESVAYSCSPEVLEALELAYYDEDEAMRLSAVLGMGRSCDLRWRSVVLRELDSDSPAMRYEAAVASGELALRQAVPTLARLIQDPDRQISNAAIWALGQIGGDPAKQVLTAAYDDADEDMEAALDEALAEHALAEGDLSFLLYDLEQDSEEDVLLDDDFSIWDADDASPEHFDDLDGELGLL